MEDYGLTELNNSELVSIMGGGWWSEFKAGFKDTFCGALACLALGLLCMASIAILL